MNFNKPGKAGTATQTGCSAPATRMKSLVDLQHGEDGILHSIDLPDDISRRLMELGFFPGQVICRGHAAPGGDPRVFRVDGSEIALRRETAAHLYLHHKGVLV